jgi:hypothetical protein
MNKKVAKGFPARAQTRNFRDNFIKKYLRNIFTKSPHWNPTNNYNPFRFYSVPSMFSTAPHPIKPINFSLDIVLSDLDLINTSCFKCFHKPNARYNVIAIPFCPVLVTIVFIQSSRYTTCYTTYRIYKYLRSYL